MRRPGIEPGSREWESCMIPLHQRRMCLTLSVKYCLKKPKPGVVPHRLYTSHIVFGLGSSVFFRHFGRGCRPHTHGHRAMVGTLMKHWGGNWGEKSDVSTDHPLRPSSSIHRLSIVRCLSVDRLVSLASGVLVISISADNRLMPVSTLVNN